MDFSKVTLVGNIEKKMSFHAARQSVLAQNIANANTPGYKSQDIAKGQFAKMVDQSNGLALTVTQPGHMTSIGGAGTAFSAQGVGQQYEVTPTGNGVVLEEEMLKMQDNSMQYQATTSMYRKMARLMTSALGE